MRTLHDEPQGTNPAQQSRLVQRAARGDVEAFGRFYDCTCREVFGMVLSVVGERSQAESITEAVYVTAWRQAPTFDPDVSTPADWLVALTGHALAVRCARHLRSPL